MKREISKSVIAGLFSLLLAGFWHGNPSNTPTYVLSGAAAACSFSASQCWNGTTAVPPTTEISVTNSGGYALTNAGAFTSFASNTARMVDRGLLVEPAATNLVLNSHTLTAATWTRSNATAVDNVTTAPDGATSAASLVDNSTNATHDLQSQAISISSGSSHTYALTCIVKANGLNFGSCVFLTVDGFALSYDLSSGRVACQAAINHGNGTCVGVPTLTPLASGWFAVCGAGTTDGSSSNANVYLYLNNAYQGPALDGGASPIQAYSGSGTGTYLWNFQVETGANCSSPIVTASSQVTRSADVVNGLDKLRSTINSATGSVVACTTSGVGGTAGTIVGVSGAELLAKTSGDFGETSIASTTTNTTGFGRWNGSNCEGIAWNSGGRTLVLDTQSPAATDAVAMTPNTALYLGSTAGSSNFFGGYIQTINVFATKLSAVALQGFTPQGPPPTPSFVQALGYTTLSFFDDFNSLSTIDASDTGNLGYNWYTHNAWPNFQNASAGNTGWKYVPGGTPTPSNDYTLVNGVLTILSSVPNTMQWQFQTARYSSTAPNGFIGTVFSGGLCIEVRASFDQSLANSNFWWIAWWMTDIKALTGAYGSTSATWTEMAHYEGNVGFTSDMELDSWTFTPTAGTATVVDATFTGPNFVATQYHTWDHCWVTAANHGGVGIVTGFFDGQEIISPTTYSATTGSTPAASPSNPTGIFFQVDSEQLIVNLATGQNWPLNIDYVAIWQLP